MDKTKEAQDWLLGSGEMYEIIHSKDWARHTLGPIEFWPQSLKTSLSICLNTKFPMLVWWGKDLLVFYNDAYIPFTGLKHPQFVGRPAREQWAESWDLLGPMTEQVLTTGKATWSENMVLFLNRKGFSEECYFTFSYSPISDETGAVVGIINPCQETTERVLGERRLKFLRDLSAKEVKTKNEVGAVASEVLANNSLDIPFSLIYLTNPDNKTASLIGFSGVEAGTPISPTTIDVSSNKVWPITTIFQDSRAIKIDNLRKKFLEYLPKLPYEEGPDSAYILPIESVSHEVPIGFLILGISPRLLFNELYEGYFNLICKQISIQITNVYTLEEEKKRVEELSELNKAKTDFFNNVSHELRTPLTLILGPLEDILSKNTSLSLEIKSELEVIYRNAIRLLKLVNNLLDFSRLESHRMEVIFEPIDLCQLTSTLASSFMSAVETAGLEYIVKCDPILEIIYVDKEMWENIVYNLLSNAFKYTLKGSITLTLKVVDNHVELRVMDTGVGIPKKDLEKIFERFHRVKNTRGRTHEGTGIGLALVKELVTLHGGSINAESDNNKGSIFTVKIPLGKQHIPAGKLKSNLTKDDQRYMRAFIQEAISLSGDDSIGYDHQASPEKIKLGRIVVAEDNADMRYYISNLLSNEYEVSTFVNGESALAEINTNPPDLVLSDVMMPVMDGFELIKNIRANKKISDIPVIFLSARAGQESTVTGIDSGADDYLVKPFSAKELLARVKQHITMFKYRKETSRLKDKFLANITHELRSPLNAIIGFVTLIHSGDIGAISKEQKEYLGYVLTSSEHLLHLINELLDLAKIEAGKIDFTPEMIDLKKLADEVTGTLKSLLLDKNITLNVVFKGNLQTVMLDRGRLKQVLYNYISNAIKFTSANGLITVRFIVDKNELRIDVEDNGIGIKEEKINQLFMDFQQLNSDPGLKSKGTGLGLALTKRIVEAQGGRVEVKSCYGKGSTFSAVFPLK